MASQPSTVTTATDAPARPFVGVTGFSTLAEVDALRTSQAHHALGDSHDLAAGVLISDATLRGESPPMPRYPTGDDAFRILEAIHVFAIPVVHFNTRSPELLERQLTELLERDGCFAREWCRRVQLNVPSPEPLELRQLRQRYPGLQFILQIPLWRSDLRGSDALRRYLAPYEGVVSHALFDPSGGRGTSLEPQLLEAARGLGEALASVMVPAIAGGLTPDNVGGVVEAFGRALGSARFSIDAEGRLRGGRTARGKVGDRLNPDKVAAYIANAASSFAALVA